MKKDRIWKRFRLLGKILATFLGLNIIFIVINRQFKLNFPLDIQSSLFFISLGLYLGFELCKNEYTRALKKQRDNIYLRN